MVVGSGIVFIGIENVLFLNLINQVFMIIVGFCFDIQVIFGDIGFVSY